MEKLPTRNKSHETPRILQQASVIAGSFKLLNIIPRKRETVCSQNELKRLSCFTPKLESPSQSKYSLMPTNTLRYQKSTSTKYESILSSEDRQREKLLSELNEKSHKISDLETTLENYKNYSQQIQSRDQKLRKVFSNLQKETHKFTTLILKANSIISSPVPEFSEQNYLTNRNEKVLKLQGKLHKLTSLNPEPVTRKNEYNFLRPSCASSLEKLNNLKGRLKHILGNAKKRINIFQTKLMLKKPGHLQPQLRIKPKNRDENKK